MSSIRFAIAIVVLVVVPAAGLVWVQSQTADRLVELEPEPVALVIPVEERLDESQVAVSILGTWGESVGVVAPDWFGTVSGVSVQVGSEVASGDVVALIGGIDRMAWLSDAAFWRPLVVRDSGDDVAELQSMLTGLGFFEGEVDGVFGRDLEVSVKAWEASIGVVRPTGRFEPGYVVWFPEPEILVASVGLVNGAPAPGAGSVVLESAVPLSAVTLIDQDGRTVAPEGVWVLQVDDVQVEMVDGVVSPDGLEALGLVLDPEGNPSSGRIRIAEPTLEITIPATAVVAAADGSLCVYVPAGAEYEIRVITVGSGRVSTVDVSSGLAAGDEVLANPADMFDAPVCG